MRIAGQFLADVESIVALADCIIPFNFDRPKHYP